MTINTNIWTPDTCSGCQVVFTWDDTVPADQRVHVFQSEVSQCLYHSGMTGTNQYNAVLDQNTRKNIVKQAGINALPSVLSTTGVSGGDLVSGAIMHYGWTGIGSGRILFIQYAGPGVAPNAVQQITIQSGAWSAVGSGKAFVVANLSSVSGITITV